MINMRSRACDEYISNRAWFRDVVGGKNLILCGTSALEFLELFDGYAGEDEIDVYALSAGTYDNIHYHIIDTLEKIDYIKHGNVLCATFNQTLNDMLSDENADIQALSEALSNYFYTNGESFDGLQINQKNIKRFEFLKECAVAYYTGG